MTYAMIQGIIQAVGSYFLDRKYPAFMEPGF